MDLIPVAPIRSEPSMAFVDGTDISGLRVVQTAIYPASPLGETLRARRVECALTLREAAKILHISPSEFSALECGKLSMSKNDWDRAIAMFTVEG